MIADRQRGSNGDVACQVVIDSKQFEIVEEFVNSDRTSCNSSQYDNDVTRKVKWHLAAANRTFYGLRDQLKSRSLQTKTTRFITH